MTYNILAHSNIFYFIYKNHNQADLQNEKRLQIIFQEIRELNPDVVMLQEVDELNVDSFKKFSEEMSYSLFYKKKTSVRKFDGNAILYKKNKFKALKKFYLDCKITNHQEYRENDELKRVLKYPSIILFLIL